MSPQKQNHPVFIDVYDGGGDEKRAEIVDLSVFHADNRLNIYVESMKMTQFDELLRFYEARLAEGSRGKQFDDWNLQQVGLDKGSYLKQPASKPVKREPEPKLIECPHCGKQFYNVDGSQDA